MGDLALHLRSVRRLTELAVTHLLPGHGPAVSFDGAAHVALAYEELSRWARHEGI